VQDIGAFEEAEALTALGGHLAALPLEPQLGKLVLYGALFGCADPMLTIACAMSYRCASTFGHECKYPRAPYNTELELGRTRTCMCALMLPRGKLVVYDALYGCADPILTIACAMSYRCDSQATMQPAT
jgi:Helicase associated domain (HA2)